MQKYIDFSKIPSCVNKIKIDVGLSYGAPQSQKWFEHDKEALYVFGFEPNTECLQILHAGNIQNKHHSHGKSIENKYLFNNLCIIPVALSDVKSETSMLFYEMQNDCGTSSLHKPNEHILGSVKKITTVPVFSLKHFFDIFDWDRFPYIEYIKIDAQGSDYNILLSAGEYLKERVVYITAEPECVQYENCENNNINNMKHFLESQGFIEIRHPNTSDPTFINKKYMHLKDDIYIYQQG
jgi:FkbM family methyltransferase